MKTLEYNEKFELLVDIPYEAYQCISDVKNYLIAFNYESNNCHRHIRFRITCEDLYTGAQIQQYIAARMRADSYFELAGHTEI